MDFQPLPPLTATSGDTDYQDLVTGSHMTGQKPSTLGFLWHWRLGVTRDSGVGVGGEGHPIFLLQQGWVVVD